MKTVAQEMLRDGDLDRIFSNIFPSRVFRTTSFYTDAYSGGFSAQQALGSPGPSAGRMAAAVTVAPAPAAPPASILGFDARDTLEELRALHRPLSAEERRAYDPRSLKELLLGSEKQGLFNDPALRRLSELFDPDAEGEANPEGEAKPNAATQDDVPVSSYASARNVLSPSQQLQEPNLESLEKQLLSARDAVSDTLEEQDVQMGDLMKKFEKLQSEAFAPAGEAGTHVATRALQKRAIDGDVAAKSEALLAELRDAVAKTTSEMSRSTKGLSDFVRSLPQVPRGVLSANGNADAETVELGKSEGEKHDAILDDMRDGIPEDLKRKLAEKPESLEDGVMRLFDLKRAVMAKLGTGRPWTDLPPIADIYGDKLRRRHDEAVGEAASTELEKSKEMQVQESMPPDANPGAANPAEELAPLRNAGEEKQAKLDALMKPYEWLQSSDRKALMQLKEADPSFQEMQRILFSMSKTGEAASIGELAAKLPDVQQINEDFEQQVSGRHPTDTIDILPERSVGDLTTFTNAQTTGRPKEDLDSTVSNQIDLFAGDVNQLSFGDEDLHAQEPQDFDALFRKLNPNSFNPSTGGFDVNRYFASLDETGIVNAGNSAIAQAARQDLLARNQDLSVLQKLSPEAKVDYMENLLSRNGFKMNVDGNGKFVGERMNMDSASTEDVAKEVFEAVNLGGNTAKVRELSPGEKPSPGAEVVSVCGNGAQGSGSPSSQSNGTFANIPAGRDSGVDDIDQALAKEFGSVDLEAQLKGGDADEFAGIRRLDDDTSSSGPDSIQLEPHASRLDEGGAAGFSVDSLTAMNREMHALGQQLAQLKHRVSDFNGGSSAGSSVQKPRVTQFLSEELEDEDDFPPMYDEERDMLDARNLALDASEAPVLEDEHLSNTDIVPLLKKHAGSDLDVDQQAGNYHNHIKESLSMLQQVNERYQNLKEKIKTAEEMSDAPREEEMDEGKAIAAIAIKRNTEKERSLEGSTMKKGSSIKKASFVHTSLSSLTRNATPPEATTQDVVQSGIDFLFPPSESSTQIGTRKRKMKTSFAQVAPGPASVPHFAGASLPNPLKGPFRGSFFGAASTSFLETHKDPKAGKGVGLNLCCAKKLGRCLNDSKCPAGYFKCPNGCMNLKKIELRGKNSLAANQIRFDDQFHVLTVGIPTLPKLQHINEDCWEGCSEEQGYCKWCGTGLCCKRKESGNGCDGEVGGYNNHVCVPPPVKRAPAHIPDKNMWQNCEAACRDQEGNVKKGPCEFCGRGLCCAKWVPGNGCGGDIGGDFSFWPYPKLNFVCVPGPPALHYSGGSNANAQGLNRGAEVMVVNGDTKHFRTQSPRVLEDLINSREQNVLYVMGPPSKKKECSDPERACNMQAERFSKVQPDGCRDQIGCDSDQICCCKMKLRSMPCHEDEYKTPTTMTGQSVCTMDSETVRTENPLGDLGHNGWSQQNFLY